MFYNCIKRLTALACCLFVFAKSLQAQPAIKTYKNRYSDSTLNQAGALTAMPYNRFIKSGGKVITFGNTTTENHAMDVCLLPGKQFIAVEHRSGIAIINPKTNAIAASWELGSKEVTRGLASTYSGITSFQYKNKTYIAWGASNSGGKSAIVFAEWNGKAIDSVSIVAVDKAAPAETAIPNQILANNEGGELFIYAVLNGNDQLLKIRFADKKIVWTAPTGVAPYGLIIVDNKAYVTNSAGFVVTNTTRENAGTPWGRAYTNPTTGATKQGSLSVIDITTGKLLTELSLGLHPTAIIKSPDEAFLYITNGNSDNISVVDVQKELVTDSLPVGLFAEHKVYFGSSPNAMAIDSAGTTLYVANGLDYALAVVQLGKNNATRGVGKTFIKGYIPTEAYPGGVLLHDKKLFVANIEAKGSRVLNKPDGLPGYDGTFEAYTIHRGFASVSVIPVPAKAELAKYTAQVKEYNFSYRIALTNLPPRPNVKAVPVPERIGEPSVFKHVVYIIKENKTYDQVFGDVKAGRGESRLCVFGEKITPNQHKLVTDFALFDNYYMSGKSSAEGHQWADAAMISDYVQKNVAAWFRSYPHRQEDALIYNKSGFIWNNALDHGKTVRVYGEACTTVYDNKLKWTDLYTRFINKEFTPMTNVTTIARLRPIIHPRYPDCDNINLPDQLRAEEFIKELKAFEQKPGDSLPNLMVLSLPNDHTAGTSPAFPTPRAMVADNDLAVGRIVEAISNSRFWDSTVIFITQDDSQSGWDHISSYRSNLLVLSKYSVKGQPNHTNYNQTSTVRTIEQILGIPPMNIIDATALPMFDCFTQTPVNYTYKLVPTNIPLNEMNKPLSTLKGKARYYAMVSANSVFKEVDGGEDDMMNRILWHHEKGDEPYPAKK